MVTKDKPFSVKTKEGKIIEFSDANQLYLWARKNKPEWIRDMDGGIDYTDWEPGEYSSIEEFSKVYEYKSLHKNKK